jgi:hypothetical protein
MYKISRQIPAATSKVKRLSKKSRLLYQETKAKTNAGRMHYLQKPNRLRLSYKQLA